MGLYKIKTVHVYPPIPIRCYDWQAYYDDLDEGSPQGHGSTEEAAIADLITNYDLYNSERK